MTGNRRRFLLAVVAPPLGVALLLLSIGAIAPESTPWRARPSGASHVYTPLEPGWSQEVFPLLGLAEVPVASVSSGGAWLAGAESATPGAARLTVFSAGCHVAAVLLFAWLLLDLGLSPLTVGGAAIAFGCAPAVWGQAMAWHPYVALLPLGLMAALLTARGLRVNGLRVWPIGLVLALVVGESLVAVPLVVVWSIVTRWAASRAGTRVSRLLELVTTAAIAGGLMLHLLSAAMGWRYATAQTRGTAATWESAVRTVTSGWERLWFTYLPEFPLADSIALARGWVTGMGPVGAVLAVAGAVWCWERSWRTLVGGVSLLATTAFCSVLFGAPVSDARPLVPLLVAAGWISAAGGLEWTRERASHYAPLLAFVVVIGVATCLNGAAMARQIEVSRLDATLAQMVEAVDGPVAAVADNAAGDGRLVSGMTRTSEPGRWIRVPQNSTAIRRALNEGRRVLAFDPSRSRLEALGWALGSDWAWEVETSARRGVPVWSVERQLPCAVVDGAGWVDVSDLANFAALGVQYTASSSSGLDLRYSGGASLAIDVRDVVSGREVAVEVLAGGADVVQGAEELHRVGAEGRGVRMPFGRRRGTLAIVRFSARPERVVARLAAAESADTARVCAAATEGELVTLSRGGRLRDLSVGSVRLFGDGWHGPERFRQTRLFARWSSARSSAIRLLLEAPLDDMRFEIEANPARSDPGLQLGLSVNGHALSTQPMPDRAVTYTWLIDASYLRPGLNTFELTGPATTSPREATGAADDRQLGYGVTAVRAGASSGHH